MDYGESFSMNNDEQRRRAGRGGRDAEDAYERRAQAADVSDGAGDGGAGAGQEAAPAGPSDASPDAPAIGASESELAESAADERERALEEQRDKYLRLAAEYENYRKRSLRERQEAGARAQADLVRHFVDVLDDVARFAHVDPATVDTATVVHGVDLVERKLLKALGAAGLEVVNPVDQPFDPARHEAVGTEPALSPEDDHMIARVYQKGYVFNGQLLRPARVVVKQWNG
jgi:molecular chaperone GrpE